MSHLLAHEGREPLNPAISATDDEPEYSSSSDDNSGVRFTYAQEDSSETEEFTVRVSQRELSFTINLLFVYRLEMKLYLLMM